MSGIAGLGDEPVDVCVGSRGGADQQRGGAGLASCGLLAEDELGHRQRTWQPVRGADAHRGGLVSATRPERPRLPRPSRDQAETVTAPTNGVNGYANFKSINALL